MRKGAPDRGVAFVKVPTILITERVASRLWSISTVRESLEHDPVFSELVENLRAADASWHERLSGSVGGSEIAPTAEVAPLSKWMSTAEVAERLGCTSRWVRAEIAEGRLKAERRGRAWFVDRERLREYVANR